MSAILFDLDRTLVDVQSHTDYEAALRDVQRHIGTWDEPPTPPTGWDQSTRRAMGILVALAGRPEWSEVSELIERHEQAAVRDSTPMPGLSVALEATSRLPRAVVTLLAPDTARAALEMHGVGLEVLVGRRSDLAAKPAPDQLIEACRLLGVHPADALMIGDSTWDLEAASRAGCGFTGLTNGARSEFPAGTDVVPDLFAVADRVQ